MSYLTNKNLNADLLDGKHAGNNDGDIPVNNGTVNTNLNADLLDGKHAGNNDGDIPINNGTLNTNLNADLLDGYHFTDIKREIYPIGATYIQFTDSAGNFQSAHTPTALFGGTWQLLFNTEGVFFRTEGGYSWENRNSVGIQTDAIRNITGHFGDYNRYRCTNLSGGAFRWVSYSSYGGLGNGRDDPHDYVLFDASRVVPTGSENRTTNRLFRVWRRTA